MSEVILMIVIGALLGYMAWDKHETRRERNKLINALMSKTAIEMRDLEFIEKVKMPDVKPAEPDLVPENEMSDEEFDKHILKQNE